MIEGARRVVFDCNVFVQALLTPNGPAGRCVELVREESLQLFWSDYVLSEIYRIPEKRAPRKVGITPAKVDRLVSLLLPHARLVNDIPSVFQHPRDPKDSHYIDLAVAADADIIASSDKHLLTLVDLSTDLGRDFVGRFPKIRVLKPRDLLAELRNEVKENSMICRFAPSPTGFLHVGGARTALYNWLLARHGGGRYLLRIEDTDLARSTQQAVDQLLEDLKWLGLNHDNADQLMFQSKRLSVYNAAIDKLLAEGKAYKAYETQEELDALRADAEKHKRAFIYRRRDYSAEQIADFEKQNRPAVVRLAMPVKDYSFTDEVLGEIKLAAAQVDDFVIRKTDGMPTYHFAVVVDDAEMKITHVVRGQEHTLNTFKHIAIQEALGFPRPSYAHLPVILNKDDGKKMGKRDRDKKVRVATRNFLKNTKKTVDDLSASSGLPASRLQTWLDNDTTQLDLNEQLSVMKVIGLREVDLPEILVHDFRKNGYLPEALLNFLALVGWNPGENIEKMSLAEMTEKFSLAGVNKAGGKFDRDKLGAFNTAAVAAASPQRLLAGLKDFLACNPDSPLHRASDSQLQSALAMCAGFRIFRDVEDKCRALFLRDDEIVYQNDAVEKVLKKNDGEGLRVLREITPILQQLEPWNHESIEAAVKSFAESKQLGLGKVAQPIRVAITGTTISPGIGASLETIGKAATMARLAKALNV